MSPPLSFPGRHPLVQPALHLDCTTTQLLDMLADLGEDLAERGPTTSDAQSELDDVFKKILVQQEIIRAQSAFFKEPPSGRSVDALSAIFSSIAPSVTINYAKSGQFKAFKERLWAASIYSGSPMPAILPDGSFAGADVGRSDVCNGSADGEELSVTAQKENLVCPITLKPFVDPYRAHCGHVFEKRAIDEMLRSNRNIPCPVAGCRQHIAGKDLVADAAMRRRVEQAGKGHLFK